MRVPHAAPVNIATWLMLRFERGSRYYRLHLEQALWGSWLVTRVIGQRSSPLGQIQVSPAKSIEERLATLAAAAKRRRLRNYALVSEHLIHN